MTVIDCRERRFLLDDALGSVRGVTDEAGDLDGTADYAVFGEVRASSGVSTLFRFTGEQHDAETGFAYLRARYANPTLGRFVSADSVQPNASSNGCAHYQCDPNHNGISNSDSVPLTIPAPAPGDNAISSSRPRGPPYFGWPPSRRR